MNGEQLTPFPRLYVLQKSFERTGREAAKKRPDAGDVYAMIEAGDTTLWCEFLDVLSLEDLVDFLNWPQPQRAVGDFSPGDQRPESRKMHDYVAARSCACKLLKEGIRKLEAQRSVAGPFQDLSKELRKETLALLGETVALEERAREH